MKLCFFIASMDDLLTKSDFVIACCALNESTKGNGLITEVSSFPFGVDVRR